MEDKVLNLAKVVPSFLDQNFFDKVVRSMENDPKAKVTQFDIKAGSKPGENFASAIFRCTMTFTSKFTKVDKTISVIIKTKPVLGPEMADYAAVIDNSPFFHNEMALYGKILPDIQALMLSAGDVEVFSPKLIYQSNEPSPVIVLEDACADGFDVIDRPPEDFEVSRKIVQRLAKFHAASFYLVNENKLDCSFFNHSIFENRMTADMLFGRSLEGFADAVREWEGFERYVPHLEAFKKSFLGKVLKTYKANRSEFGFNVLNHADFHLRNLLFKKNVEGTIEDFYFIDYQICNYASPAIDLIYALYYMLSTENRQTRRAEFITCYHSQFVASLKKFGYMKVPPSLIDLQVELLKNGNLEVLLAVCNVIVFYFDLSTMTPEDFDQGDGTRRFYKRLYNNPDYKAMILKELPRFLHNGFI